MAKVIKSNELVKVVSDELKLYSHSVTEGMKKVNDECMKQFVKDTERDAPKSNTYRSGTYSRYINAKTTLNTPNRKVNTWFVEKPEYRLTHLIKNGHAKRNGGRTKAQDFITPNYNKLEKEFNEKIEEVISRGY